MPLGGERLARAALRDHHPQGGLLHLPRRQLGSSTSAARTASCSPSSDPNAPDCKECHGTHGVLGKHDPQSPTFPTNVPDLCARCHREGQKAAVRYTGAQHEIIEHYTESIHGKGLLKSGLTVTATCTSCHTAHRELPASDPDRRSIRKNVPATCGKCHHGIEEQFVQSVHSRRRSPRPTSRCRCATTATPPTPSGAPTRTASSSTS